MAYYTMVQRSGLGQALTVPDVAPPNGGACDPSSVSYNPVSCIPANAPIATPPIVSDQPSTYTLPVEVFTQTVPVPVSRPEPTMAPIPITFSAVSDICNCASQVYDFNECLRQGGHPTGGPTSCGDVPSPSPSPLSVGLILAMMAGLLLTLPGKRKK